MPLPRSLIFVFYFGRLPRFFPLFLESCKRNTNFNWLMFTDQNITAPLPGNFQVEKTSLAELQAFFSDRLKMTITIHSPYKLCDIRPALGALYHDRLTGYDFWGHCDLDVIFGDLSRLLAEGHLDTADVFTPYDLHPNGSFNLYRNREFINHLYEAIPQFQIAFRRTSPSYFLDEFGMQLALLTATEKVNWVRTEIYESELSRPRSLSVVHIQGDGSPLRYSETRDTIYVWNNGRAFVELEGQPRREVLMLHFNGLQHPARWVLYDGRSTPALFYLSKLGYNPEPWSGSFFWKYHLRRKVFFRLANYYARLARR